METKLTFAEYLEDYIESNHIRKADLAKQLNVGKSTITKWCCGTVEPRLYQLKALATVLNMDFNYFFGVNDTKLPSGYSKKILEAVETMPEDTQKKIYEIITLINTDKKTSTR